MATDHTPNKGPYRSTIAIRLTFQAWSALLGLGLALWLVISQATLLLELGWILLGAVLLGLGIRPLADRLLRWHVPRGITFLVTYLLLLAAIFLTGSLVVPIVSAEVAQLRQNAPQLWQAIQAQLSGTPLVQWLPTTDALVQSLSQQLDRIVTTAISTVAGVGGILLDLLVLTILAYFITIDEGWGSRIVLNWTPPRNREHVQQIISNIGQSLGRWVWAQIGIGIYFAVTFGLALIVLRIPFALTIGIVGGILEVIPYLGGFVAFALGVLSALTISPVLALWVSLAYLVISVAEGHIVAPFLYGRALGLRSVVVLVALFIGARAAGVLGVFFAVPVAVILTAIVQAVQHRIFLEVEGEGP